MKLNFSFQIAKNLCISLLFLLSVSGNIFSQVIVESDSDATKIVAFSGSDSSLDRNTGEIILRFNIFYYDSGGWQGDGNHDFIQDLEIIYQTDDDDYNLGKTSLQCGRRNDALKLWTLWKSVGTNGIENLIDHQFYLAEVAREYVRSNPNYTLYSFDESVSICFNYKGIPAKKLAYELYMHAQLMVSHGSFKGTDFIRLVTINSDNAKQDIYNFFHTIESFVANNDLPFKENINSTP